MRTAATWLVCAAPCEGNRRRRLAADDHAVHVVFRGDGARERRRDGRVKTPAGIVEVKFEKGEMREGGDGLGG